MKEWTVVLERSGDLMQYVDPDERDRRVTADRIYVAIGVKANSGVEALGVAVQEAFNADANNEEVVDFDHTFEDYSLIVMFEGACKPVMFGFNT